jgi:maltose alpha-D-glucosyltransferase / alpha-amylase
LREIGFGTVRPVEVDCPPVLGLRHDTDTACVVMLANLGPDDVEVTIADDDLEGLVDVLADDRYPTPDVSRPRINLRGYGYRWLRPSEQLFD